MPQVREGEVASLRLTAGIYPPPQPGNVNWSIRDVPGGQEETLHLQPGDQTGRYQASPLQVGAELRKNLSCHNPPLSLSASQTSIC